MGSFRGANSLDSDAGDFEVVSNDNEKTRVNFNYESLSFFDRQKTKQ